MTKKILLAILGAWIIFQVPAKAATIVQVGFPEGGIRPNNIDQSTSPFKFKGIEVSTDPLTTPDLVVSTASGGRVGIWTATPTEALEVAGNIKAVNFIGNGSQLTGVPLSPGSTSYVQNTNDLQAGSSYHVASGTVAGTLSVNTRLSIRAPNDGVLLKSSGGICYLLRVLDSGALQTESMACQ